MPAPTEDEPASDVRTQVDGRTLSLTNLDKVLYPLTGTTKAEVISYYLEVAPTLLPYLAGRPVSRLRFPNGVPPADEREARGGTTPLAEGAFWEKNAPAGTPGWVRRQRVGTSDGVVDYVLADEPATLVWLANLAALELHTPQWRVGSGRPDPDGVLDLPGEQPREGEPLADRVVVDLDPGAGVGLLEVAEAALVVATEMAQDGLLPVAQTSGSKGVQVFAALAPCRCRDAWAYAKTLNHRMAARHPKQFVAAMSVEQRRGKVYLDYNQNLAARNTVSPYSLRGRERPSVATPVGWDELADATTAARLRFTPEQVLARLAEHGDLAAELLAEDRPPLPRVDN